MNSLLASPVPNGIKNQIIEADNSKVDVPNYAYEEFLKSFPSFNSLYTKINNEEIAKLEQGMDPADPLFDSELENIVFDDFFQLILNEEREVYIRSNGRPLEFGFTFGLYKLYDSCRAVVFENNLPGAYQDQSLLDPNGNIGQLPIIVEDPSGVNVNDMNNYIPTSATIFNPQITTPTNSSNDPLYNTEGQVLNFDDRCPISYWNYNDKEELFEFEFSNYTDTVYPNTNYIQYWLFGDGTGSFKENPTHKYSGQGTYEVKLITFTDDCGCWHVSKKTIVIDEEYFQLKNGCEANIANYIDFNSDQFIGTGIPSAQFPNASVSQYRFELYQASNAPAYPWESNLPNPVKTQYSNDQIFDISDQPDGAYKIRLVIIWNEGCGATYASLFPYTKTSGADCCDRSNRKKKIVTEWSWGSKDYRLKTKDYAYPSYWLNFQGGGRFKSWQKFYRKGSLGLWLGRKADQNKTTISGSIWSINTTTAECQNEEPIIGFPFTNSCSDCKKVKVTYNTPNIFGMKEGSVEFDHFIFYNGNSKSIPTITLGETANNCN